MRELLVIAHAVASLATARDHILALGHVGAVVPYGALDRVQRSLERWEWEWVQRMGPDFTPVESAATIAAARAYLTEHQVELDELLNLERGVDERAEEEAGR